MQVCNNGASSDSKIKPPSMRDEDAKRRKSFEKWMDKHGIEHSLLKICHFKSTGRGIKAVRDIAEGAPVLQVPDSAVLLAEEGEVANDMESLGFSKADADSVYESVPLILNLMVEKVKGKSSKWAGYLNFLPESLPGLPFQWDKVTRRILCGTSTLHAETMRPFQHPPAAVWDIFRTVVEPWFAKAAGVPAPAGGDDALWQLYRWATSIVSAYSFELGSSRLQCLVPLWDALNHVTGEANVRLAHDAEQGRLLMIATQDIVAGEEVINDYGPLSNGELLRRYGFVEPCTMPLEQLGRVAAQARIGESFPSATLAHAHWDAPNKHDAATVPLQDVIRVAASHGGFAKRGAALQARLDFMHAWGIIPDSQRYAVACDGELQPAGAEAFRILSMSPASFRAFQASVESWRPLLPLPCASLHRLDLSKSFQALWCGLVVAAVARRRSLLPPPSLALEVVASAVGLSSAELSAEQAATTVAVGEWVALDSCLARVTGQALDGASMRMLHLEASDDACPRPRGGAPAEGTEGTVADADSGAPWLLQLSRRFWADNVREVYDQRMAEEDDSD